MMGVSRERSEHDADGRIRHGSEHQRTEPQAAT